MSSGSQKRHPSGLLSQSSTPSVLLAFSSHSQRCLVSLTLNTSLGLCLLLLHSPKHTENQYFPPRNSFPSFLFASLEHHNLASIPTHRLKLSSLKTADLFIANSNEHFSIFGHRMTLCHFRWISPLPTPSPSFPTLSHSEDF